jgi:YD repeat-containing protein
LTALSVAGPLQLDGGAVTTSGTQTYGGSVTLGNNTKQEDWISGTTYASSTRVFNSYGLVATSTDRGNHSTSFVYDAYNLFPATTTNALLQKTNIYYNYANGKAKQSSDPNSRLSKNVFDGFGRLTEIDRSSTTTPTTTTTPASRSAPTSSAAAA